MAKSHGRNMTSVLGSQILYCAGEIISYALFLCRKMHSIPYCTPQKPPVQ